jgi:hypothetical protein
MSHMDQDGLPEGIVHEPFDAAHPPRTVAFAGYLGESHRDGFVRLYLDEELREWFDVAESDILYSDRYGEGSLRQTVLWVDQRTTLERRVPQREDLEAEYIEGRVAAESVSQSAMSVALDFSILRRTPMKTPWC